MRSELDVLLDKITDDALRADIRGHVDRLRSRRTFGLVFEAHLPERVRLPEHPVRVGVKVCYRDEKTSPSFEVQKIKNKTATMRMIRHPDGRRLSDVELKKAEPITADLRDLVVIADFGEPVFPGLTPLGSIERAKGKSAHTVIKGENHHVLEALQFTHASKIDCIFIDPPYNSGASDWKYDNNYVDDSDVYRHSKWLAFMERRLLLAKRLLNPEDSVLIVTIDEKEYLRLGLLLEQIFPAAQHQMVTTVIKPEGTGRANEFSRTNEFIFFVTIGGAVLQPGTDNMYDSEASSEATAIEWRTFRRREKTSKRGSRPNQFYAVFVDEKTGKIHSVGDPLADDVLRKSIKPPKGTRAVFPLRPDGQEMIWSAKPSSFRKLVEKGYARMNGDTVQFLNSGTVKAIESGTAVVTGRDEQGAVIAEFQGTKLLMPKTVWTREAHNAQTFGTLILSKLVPGNNFPFPKSLYAVEDTLRFFLKKKKNAVVVDFFGGSGTTAHAVARLNRQDQGHRQTILITNNEVSAEEAEALRKSGHRPGDPEWEKLGIFEHVTKPRITAAITGKLANGEPLDDEYKFVDPFPMEDGFEENVEFFALSYLDLEAIELDKAFSSIAPLLWLRAGAVGPIIDERRTAGGKRKPFEWTDGYGVLFNTDAWRSFVEACPKTATTAFIVTDSQTTFSGIVSELPTKLDTVRLYENYLTTFAINHGSF